MRALFFHQNFPGQFRHLVPKLVADGHEVVFVTQKDRPSMPGVRKVEYAPHREVTKGIHHYLVQSERAVLNAQGVARALLALRDGGYRPDVMIGNPGWGETLLAKDVYADVPLVSYCEFYYRGQGSDVGFDPEFPATEDMRFRARIRAGVHLLALEAADYRYSPTDWQRDQFPAAYRDSIEVIHDGIDVDRLRPDPEAQLAIPGLPALKAGDPVVTYVARNLEPYRGFHVFMRALPAILARHPRAHVLVVGGDGVSYGAPPARGGTWRKVMLAETPLSPERVHFLGRVDYATFRTVLQVSAAHVYLTYPFVLSWSMLEAMAAGCAVVGSRTPPVEEVLTDGDTGLLADFFSPAGIADRVCALLDDRALAARLGRAARETVAARFRLQDCLARQQALFERAVNEL